MELNMEEEEPSVIDYARSHGICINYTTDQMRVENIHVPPDADLYQDLRDPSDASITNALNELIKERLAVSKDAVLLLKAVHSFQEPFATDVLATDGRKRILGLKQELPVLLSDYELDMLQFGSAAMPNFRDLRIPSEISNEESDEGFEWPAKYLAYPAQSDDKVKAEKIAVSREALAYLQDAIRDEYTAEDFDLTNAERPIYKSNPATVPLTPPLLPLSPPSTPYIPSSPANQLPLLSDSSDSLARETTSLEHQIMAADCLARKSSDSSDSMLLDITDPPQYSPLSGDRVSLSLKRTAENLKVEGPLTPPVFSTSPMKKLKSVSFSKTLPEFIPYAPWTGDLSDEDSNASIEFDELFKDIEPFVKQANKRVENEQLSGADTTARVPVPDVDFTLPMTPWNEYKQPECGKHRSDNHELDAQKKFLLRIKREDLKTATSWHGLSALERDLRWGIFTTKVSSVNLDEKIHGETDLKRMLTELTTCDVATSSSQVWKHQGLRMMDDNEDEEELEEEEEDERDDVDALIRKRKLEMEEEVTENKRTRAASQEVTETHDLPPRVALENHPWREKSTAQQVHLATPPKTFNHHQQTPQASASQHKSRPPSIDTGNELMFGGFSATSALRKFMETRGKLLEPVDGGSGKLAPKVGASMETTRNLPVRSREPSPDPPVISGPHSQPGKQAVNANGGPSLRSLPALPALPKDLAPCSFIVSSSLLQQRSLMKQIEQLYSGAEILYRDYNLPHSAAKEADILLSPSSGLIFTTLQEVKQRALPGQPDRSPVKERMVALQLRYERLVVLVSEGLSREMEALGSSRPDDPRDKDVISSFKTFASHLESDVLLKYVRGGEQSLAHSVVLEMISYGLPHGSADIGDIKPLAVETSWEIFLRRVGLNPFAAQVLVASLKQPFDVHLPISFSVPSNFNHPTSVSVSGLPAFFMMDEEKRIKYFQALMGGSRILRRVSRVLDQEWVSAAHGFRM